MGLIQRTLNRVVERKDVNPLSVLDIVAGMDICQISELDSQVVSGDCNMHLISEPKARLRQQLSLPLFKAILPSSTSSEDKQIKTVSFLFFPLGEADDKVST